MEVQIPFNDDQWAAICTLAYERGVSPGAWVIRTICEAIGTAVAKHTGQPQTIRSSVPVEFERTKGGGRVPRVKRQE